MGRATRPGVRGIGTAGQLPAAFHRRCIARAEDTPIFNIQGFIHTLLDGAIHDPEVNMQYLTRAAKNVDRLQAIVEDLETINKLEAGQMVLDLREFDMHDLAEEVFADLEMRAKERNIRLVLKKAPTSITGCGPTRKVSGRC